MSESLSHEISTNWPVLKHLGLLALVGTIVGLGQALAETPKLPARVIVGRSLSSAGMGACAGGVLAWLPDMPLVAQCALAAAMASLGTSGIVMMLQRLFAPKG